MLAELLSIFYRLSTEFYRHPNTKKKCHFVRSRWYSSNSHMGAKQRTDRKPPGLRTADSCDDKLLDDRQVSHQFVFHVCRFVVVSDQHIVHDRNVLCFPPINIHRNVYGNWFCAVTVLRHNIKDVNYLFTFDDHNFFNDVVAVLSSKTSMTITFWLLSMVMSACCTQSCKNFSPPITNCSSATTRCNNRVIVLKINLKQGTKDP